MAVYAATKNAVRTITEGLRQEVDPHLRVTGISHGFVATGFSDTITDPEVRAAIQARAQQMAFPASAVATAIAINSPPASRSATSSSGPSRAAKVAPRTLTRVVDAQHRRRRLNSGCGTTAPPVPPH